MRTKLLLGAGAFVAALVALPGVCHAQSTTVMSATACFTDVEVQSYASIGPLVFFRGSRLGDTLYNHETWVTSTSIGRQTGGGTYICPWGRGSTSAPRNVNIDFRNSGGSSLQCAVRGVDWNGNFSYSSPWVSSSSTADHFNIVVPTNVVGYLTIRCRMTGAAELVGYNIS